MPTLILSPRHTPSSQKMWRAAIESDWDVERLPSFRIPKDFHVEDPAPYGEPIFNEIVADHFDLVLDQPDDDFLVRLDKKYTGRNITLMETSEARKIDCPMFFKPPNRKTFKAAVYESGEVLPEMVCGDHVLVSDIMEFHSEFRFFILDKKILALSNYTFEGSFTGDFLHEISEYVAEAIWEEEMTVYRFVEKLLEDSEVKLPRTVVIDAGFPKSGSPVIIEANEVCASGLYQCDPKTVLDVLKIATRKRTQDSSLATS